MRVLALCVAAFAGGLLAGALVWTAGAPPRDRAREPEWAAPFPSPGPSSRPRARDDRPPREEASAPDPGDLPPADVGVRDLAEEAAAELEKTLAGDVATRFLDGDGVIRGTVRDADGRPVAGATVTAAPEAQPFRLALSSRLAREQPHLDRDLADVARDAMQGELWRRHVRRAAVTGADGGYEIRDLAKSRHRLTAYHGLYTVKPVTPQQANVEPDAVVDFVAQPAQEVRVEVRLPDGTPPEYAWLSWTGPQGSGGDSWTPDPGTVRLPVGTCRVRAQAWVPGPLQSPEVERRVSAAASEEVLVLQLEGRRVLEARLDLPEGLAMPESVEFGLRRVEAGAPLDADSLKLEEMQKGHGSTAGRAAWYDLEPGHYAVAAFLDRRWLLGHAVARLGEEATEVGVPMEGPGADALAVVLLDPGGGPVGGRAWFHVYSGPKERRRGHAAAVLRGTDGTWFLRVPDLDRSGEALLRATAQGYGTAHEPFDARSPGRVTVRFRKPASLRLRVERYAGSAVVGRLQATLWAEGGWAASRQVPADGACDFGSVQPGDYALYLHVQERNDRWAILRQDLSLGAGDHERSVAVPALYALRVRVPGNGGGTVVLTSRDPAIGSARRDARAQDGIAAFDALAAASYEVQIGGRRMEVRVPGPSEVSFE